MALKAGDKAPNFQLFASDKTEVSLKDLKGRNVVLLFFPQAFTGVCTKEMCSTRDDLAFYQNLDAEVLAVSVDSVFTLKKFKEDQNLNFKLLSDFNKKMSKAYGALYADWILGMKGVSRRAAFVIVLARLNELMTAVSVRILRKITLVYRAGAVVLAIAITAALRDLASSLVTLSRRFAGAVLEAAVAILSAV
ncbi:MAG: peroxiredoxin, partial [Bacteroidetes bacterium]|nr:peroxiredoxin [Bacteroidota bacterium]